MDNSPLTPPDPSATPDETPDRPSRDAEHWSQVSRLSVSNVPVGAINLNVDGRRVVGPLQGFGRLWQKTYRLPLSDVTMTPVEVMQIWKANFTHFQPPENRFFAVVGDVEPGHILLINASMTGMLVSTG